MEENSKNTKVKSKKSMIVVAATLALLALCVIVAKKQSGANQGPGGMKRGRGGGNTVVSVKTQILEKTTLHGYISTNGEIESQNSVNVFPDVSGKVMETRVMLGSPVKRGDIIAYIDPSAPGQYYKQSPVYAPISGSIISTPLKNGTTVSTNTTIAIVGDIANLQVSANIPERYVAVLKTGLKADVSVQAYPDVVFKATVTRVSPVVDTTSRTKEVILLFDGQDERINAGMFGKVKLFTEDYTGEVVMPVDSLVQNGDEYFAYVVNEDSTVSKRKVTLGNSVDGIVQILSGVNEGERVVVQGQTSLGDGSKVQDITNGVANKAESVKPEKKE
ncbi:efflux RND transporter periplasmic adaptor subunit [uncultured Treponema sp.]|uniref:efflux RND transporter periplasmic adaptor subunit n=1 Tax=uncultured Treponema sp. TaxID=162155 RepID=UPI0025FF03D8|nr:efflux RND transporter periplasmic adaptor subunit [uncultured Treponema sp.]